MVGEEKEDGRDVRGGWRREGLLHRAERAVGVGGAVGGTCIGGYAGQLLGGEITQRGQWQPIKGGGGGAELWGGAMSVRRAARVASLGAVTARGWICARCEARARA